MRARTPAGRRRYTEGGWIEFSMNDRGLADGSQFRAFASRRSGGRMARPEEREADGAALGSRRSSRCSSPRT